MPFTPFIETQFPLAILSAESYKERKAGRGQTLTGLGKWWGRKPLVLVRATLTGLLMPAGDDPAMDRHVFLRILTMDPDGLWLRKTKAIKAARVAQLVAPDEGASVIHYSGATPKWQRRVDKAEKKRVERLAFSRMPYGEKLEYCVRPEDIEGPSRESWKVINDHLGTTAASLQELFAELSQRVFGRNARVGDVFCGGGSIPFEAARLGFEAWGSDLSPVAALLTWASINVIGGGQDVQEQVHRAQEAAWRAVDGQFTEWGIEHDEHGNRADAYLYCVEAKSPATGMWVPLAPSWVISEKYRVVASLRKREDGTGYHVDIERGVAKEKLEAAKTGTVQNGYLVCPETGNRYSISGLRGPQGLRLWENEDLVPRPDDVLQERLYCVRWRTPDGEYDYRSVTKADVEREEKVLSLLHERFESWQEAGFIPSRKLAEHGDKTQEPIRTRGWTHWHHLFHPRQLLLHGLFADSFGNDGLISQATQLLGIGLASYNNTRLARWRPQMSKSGGVGAIEDAFANQALNPVYNYPARGALSGRELIAAAGPTTSFRSQTALQSVEVGPIDARNVSYEADLWITDPPYADAINYHELGDFFLAWYEKHLPKLFPDWYADSKPALAVRGTDEDFKQSMVDIYSNLATHMPDDGFQVVMFTHQDAGVWADLGMILWAAGLKVTAAWTVATETSNALKKGNYVQGTVFLVLRKRLDDHTVFLDELYPMVDDEVRAQLDHMHAVDDEVSPQFGDTDLQLAAYAAALRVLTAYAEIEGKEIRHELFRVRERGEKSAFEQIIERAISIASQYLVPRGIGDYVWRTLNNTERLYLRGLELERHGETRAGAYSELARGFGVQEYSFLFGTKVANSARFKTPGEFGRSYMADDEWGESLVRQLLFAVHQAAAEEDAREGLKYLKASLADYWTRREEILAILSYLEQAGNYATLRHWHGEAQAAELLRGLVENDYGGSATP